MIKPDDVQVDRTSESEWIAVIDAELCKPWGAEESERSVNMPKTFNHEGLGDWIRRQYEDAGWKCAWHYEIGPKPKRITFQRPAQAPTIAQAGSGAAGPASPSA